MPLRILKRILSSDWLPERIKWVHHARLGLHGLSLRKKEIVRSELTEEFVSYGQCQRRSRKKAVEDGQNKEKSWVYWASKTVGSLSHLLK